MFEDIERPGLVERAAPERRPTQIAEHQIVSGDGLASEKWTDVNAHEPSARLLVPRERTPTAAAKVDDAIAGTWREESPKHVETDLGPEHRWRNHLVTGVGMERFVGVLGLLGKG